MQQGSRADPNDPMEARAECDRRFETDAIRFSALHSITLCAAPAVVVGVLLISILVVAKPF
jgi:hypothetical protein